MGCKNSAVQNDIEDDENDKNRNSEKSVSVMEWKVLPSSTEARVKFEQDGTLHKESDPGHLELRTMLDDAISQAALGKYAKEIQKLDIFMCWVDIQEFKSIPSESYRRTKALHIYHKYVKKGAVLCVEKLKDEEREAFHEKLNEAKDDPSRIEDKFYDTLQQTCFLAMYHNIYVPYKLTVEYYQLVAKLKKKYNSVRPDDFEYYNRLGEGGFGFVIRCKKKSTGKYYAMKLQTKKGLLDLYAHDPWRADYEKKACAMCQHPFIVTMDYAFQTPSLAIMVLSLSNAGDLNKALSNSESNGLGEERVRFYVAEMLLALSYLHQLGLIYRDLKPGNVLLGEDGHVQLVDLGGVSDEAGSILGEKSESDGLVPLFTQTFVNQNKVQRKQWLSTVEEGQNDMEVTMEVDNESNHSNSNNAAAAVAEKDNGLISGKPPPLKRKLSIMGTFGYMAPEMVVMMSQTRREKTGYTAAVDYWSLGATMFKLLTGKRPFSDENFEDMIEMATVMQRNVDEHAIRNNKEYVMLFKKVNYPDDMEPDTKDMLSHLLDTDPETRFGSRGLDEVFNHPYFKGIDWNKLEMKHIDPPFVPNTNNSQSMKKNTSSKTSMLAMDFTTAMEKYNKSKFLGDEMVLPAAKQKYFANWYVSN